MAAGQHIPVLLTEAVEALVTDPCGIYVDCTFGRGGHSRAILSRLSPGGRLIAFDRDPRAVEVARVLAAEDSRFSIVHAPFSELSAALEGLGVAAVDGV